MSFLYSRIYGQFSSILSFSSSLFSLFPSSVSLFLTFLAFPTVLSFAYCTYIIRTSRRRQSVQRHRCRCLVRLTPFFYRLLCLSSVTPFLPSSLHSISSPPDFIYCFSSLIKHAVLLPLPGQASAPDFHLNILIRVRARSRVHLFALSAIHLHPSRMKLGKIPRKITSRPLQCDSDGDSVLTREVRR